MTWRWVEFAALLALAWAAAIPVTCWFATRAWTACEPLASLVAWQAIGLVGGLAILTAELTLATTQTGGRWSHAVMHALAHPTAGGPTRAVGLLALAATLLWLLAVLVSSFARMRRYRAEHRTLLELLSTPVQEHGAPLDVLTSPTPMAYALPRASPGGTAHIVISTATRERLDTEALRAVIAHERAHLRQRHSLLVQPFIAWERSLPLTSPQRARRRVEQLIEIACDDAARRAVDNSAVLEALRAVVPASAQRTEREARIDKLVSVPALRCALLVASAVVTVGPPLALAVAGR